MKLLISTVVFLLLNLTKCSQDDPCVKLNQAVLRGQTLKTRKGASFTSFTGIPYAEPPVGELRFKAPLPAGPWNGVLDATRISPICPQGNQDGPFMGSEDCLYLDVYTPRVFPDGNSSTLLPVMVFIHGGAFITLAPLGMGPEYLLDKGIVLVTFNYRLGALGFLSTGDEVVPGNNGLKDQNLALRWVKSNIAHFGGDPSRVTLFGQSVGGCSVNLHMLSPLSKGLFQAAISQSGTAVSPRALSPHDQGPRNSRKLAEGLKCPTSFSQKMVQCLTNLKVEEILAQQGKFSPWKIDRLAGFRPVIEPNIDGAFLAEHPIDVYKAGKAANVPFMTGVTTEDNPQRVPHLFTKPGLLEEFNDDFDKVAATSLLYEEVGPNAAEVGKRMREFYFANGQINGSSKSQVMKMYMDAMILLPADAVVRLHKAYSKRPVFYYVFGYRVSNNFCDRLGDPSFDYGVCHTDDLFHLFKLTSHAPREADERVTDVMLTLWTNFAKTGNPTPDTETMVPKWNPVQSDRMEYFFFKNYSDMKMADSFHADRIRFWNSLPINFRSYHVGDEIKHV